MDPKRKPQPLIRFDIFAITIAIAAVVAFILRGPSAFFGLDPAATGRAILHGKIPYRDFAFEYPPGAAALFGFIAIFGSAHFMIVFRLLMAMSWGYLAWLEFKDDRKGFAVFCLASAAYSFIIDAMFDTVVALTVYLAFRAMSQDRRLRASSWTGIATSLKILPISLGPLIVRSTPVNQRAAKIATLSVALVIAIVVPRAIAHSGNDPIAFQAGRDLHAESTFGTLTVLERSARHANLGVEIDHRSLGVAHAGAEEGVAYASLTALLVLMFFKGDPENASLWMATLLAIPALGPVASPQLFVWPLGLVAKIPRLAQATYIAAGAISFAYFMLPAALQPSTTVGSAILLARNLLALASVVCCARAGLHFRHRVRRNNR